MSSIYDKKEKLQQILTTFKDYIQHQNYFDIVYSEKIGYMRVLVESPEEGAIVLDTPEVMLSYLCDDVISDVVYSQDNPNQSHDDLILSEYEETESRRRLINILKNWGTEKEYYLRIVDKYIRRYQGIETD